MGSYLGEESTLAGKNNRKIMLFRHDEEIRFIIREYSSSDRVNTWQEK